MIPKVEISRWRQVAPWSANAQVEQDLVISRALVEVFDDDMLRNSLAFRGGTALHKLYFPRPLRYSEDIDLVQIRAEHFGPVLDGLRARLEPWLGRAKYDRGAAMAKLAFRFLSEDATPLQLRLKVEVNTREHHAFDGLRRCAFEVASGWFAGRAEITTYSLAELLATKLRALYQRRKGRDAFDLVVGLDHPSQPDSRRIARLCVQYLEASGVRVRRTDFVANLEQKASDAFFLADMDLLLAAEAGKYSAQAALKRIHDELVQFLPE